MWAPHATRCAYINFACEYHGSIRTPTRASMPECRVPRALFCCRTSRELTQCGETVSSVRAHESIARHGRLALGPPRGALRRVLVAAVGRGGGARRRRRRRVRPAAHRRDVQGEQADHVRDQDEQPVPPAEAGGGDGAVARDQRGTPPSSRLAGGARRHEPDPPRLGRGGAARAVRRLRRGRLRAGGAPVRRRPPAVVRRGGPAGGARPRAVAAGGAHGQRARPPRDGGVRRPRRGRAAPGSPRAADALDEAGGRRAAARHAVLEPAARRRRRPAAERARAPRVRRDGRLSAAVWRRGEHARVVWRRSSRDPRALTPPIPTYR